MNLKELNEKLASKKQEMADLVAKVQVEARAFTEEEDKLFNNLEADIKSINSTMEKINACRKLTEEDAGKNTNSESKTSEERALEEKELEKRELENFGKYIRNEALEERAGEVQFKKGANGAIVPSTIANKIIFTAYNVSPILQKVTQYNCKGKISIPVYGKDDSGNDITVSYAEDFTSLTEKAGKFSSVDLEDYLIGALAKLGNSLINNTDIDLANIVINIMADYIRMFLEKEILVGTTGKITGCKSITKIYEVATAAITYDDLVKTKNKVIQAYRKGSCWVMNQDTATAVELIKDSDGKPMFLPDPTGEFDGKVLGYPVYVSDAMPGIAAGNRPIIFGNFSGIALKRTKDLEIQILRELYATQHATGIVAWLQADADVENVQKLSALDIKAATAGNN